jgi:hypothetical protein
MLLNCPKLRIVSIDHVPHVDWNAMYWSDDDTEDSYSDESSDEDDDEDEDGQRAVLETSQVYTSMHYLVPFSGLTTLNIADMDDDLDSWRTDLIYILKASPAMKALGLSIDQRAVGRLSMNREFDKYRGFFQSFCNQYASNDGQPLHLKSLRLGLSVLLISDSPEYLDPSRADNSHVYYTASYLSKLTELSVLEEIHIENRNYYDEGECIGLYGEMAGRYSGIAWWSFTQENTPNLRRFTAHQYVNEVHEFLRDSCSRNYTSQIAISFTDPDNNNYDYGQEEALYLDHLLEENDEYPNQPLRFRMIESDCRHLSEELDIPGLREKFVASRKDQWTSLEGIFIVLRGENHTGLCGLDLIVDILPSLNRLEQLQVGIAIDHVERNHEEYDSAKQFFGSMAYKLEVALRLVNSGKGLRYIKVGNLAWRVCRDSNAEANRLLVMDSEEQLEVEQFRAPDAISVCYYRSLWRDTIW